MLRTDLIASAALALLLACGGRHGGEGGGDRAVLVIESPVADAVLWVDGRYVAQLRDVRGGVRLPPGAHQIELRHDSYHAYYGDLALRAGQTIRLRIDLAPRL